MTVEELKKITADNESKPLGTELTCAVCGTKFKKRTEKHKFCSTQCKSTYYQQTSELAEAVCEHCGKTFKYKVVNKKPRFCSYSCVSLAAGVPTKTCTCIDCGVSFEFKGRTKRLRCDPCRKKWQSLQTMLSRQRRNPGVQIGVGSGGTQKCNAFLEDPEKREIRLAKRRAKYHANLEKYRKQGTHKSRKYVLDNSFECTLCGFDKYKESLCVHHINMNREDNNPDNLTVLCANCHQYFHQRIKQLAYNKEIDPQYELEMLFNEHGKETKTITQLLEQTKG